MVLQVWKADEYYFFRVKPLPGCSIIDLLGQSRTDLDCELHFVAEYQVMINIAGERMLTFDTEGYVQKKQFAEINGKVKILSESQFFEKNKFYVVQDESKNISVLKNSL